SVIPGPSAARSPESITPVVRTKISNVGSARLAAMDSGLAPTVRPGMTLPQIQRFEEVVALVVDDDEGREVYHLDAPDRFHAELGIFDALDFFDAVLRKVCGRAADRGEIEAAVLFAGLAHARRAIALGEHHQRAAGGLEFGDERIHAAG